MKIHGGQAAIAQERPQTNKSTTLTNISHPAKHAHMINQPCCSPRGDLSMKPKAEKPASRLTFKGVSDKKKGHTGYFEYKLDGEGRIFMRWDPVIPKHPFSISCDRRRELPIASFDPSPKEMQNILSKIISPYLYTYNAESSSVTVTPRTDLSGKGFILRNGKLEEVPLEYAQQFLAHDGTGGPELPNGVKIVEMQVDNEIVVARASNNQIYAYKPNVKPRIKNVEWQQKLGFLQAGKLILPKNVRDWAFGVSTHAKPKERRGLEFANPWTDINSYYGKANNKTAFASTLTLGALFEDGRTIRLWDTGLPPDFHRGFLTPHHGAFLGEKIAQAGSTWLLYGYEPDGAPGLYYRLYDYENFGACIGMQHSFKGNENSLDMRVHDPGVAIRTIPLKGWERIEFPKLATNAVVTDHMSIHTTGEGDDAREIRIEGKNEQGLIGYFYKGIAEHAWRFMPTNEKSLLGRHIPIGKRMSQKITSQPLTRNYDETAKWNGIKPNNLAKISLLNFHPYQSQAESSTLRFTLPSAKTIDVRFLTADAWSPFTRLKDEDKLAGEGCGVAKALMGTLDIPENVLVSTDPEIVQFVKTYLLPYHQIPNVFEVIADLDNVSVVTNGIVRRDRERLPIQKLPPWSFECGRNTIGETYFEKKARAAVVTEDMSAASLRKMLEYNSKLKASIHKKMHAIKKHSSDLVGKWRKFRILLGVVRGLTTITFLKDNPYMGAVLDLSPRLLSVYQRAHKRMRDAKGYPPGVIRALDRIEANIQTVEQLLLRTG